MTDKQQKLIRRALFGSPLQGYKEPPPGISVRQGLYYNPYFPGGVISMPKMLANGAVEYDDGTPATESQMAKVGSPGGEDGGRRPRSQLQGGI